MAGEADQDVSEKLKKLSELESMLEAMKKEVKGAKQAKEEIEGKLRKQDEELLSDDYLAFLESRERKPVKEEEDDLEALTQTQLAKRLEGKSQAALQAALAAADKKVQQLTENFTNAIAYFDLELTKVKNPDLEATLADEKGKNTFLQIARENPGWNARKIHQQMKAESMLAEKDREVAESKKRTEEEKVIAEQDTLTPAAVSSKTVSKEQAGEIAYRQAFGNKET